MNTAAHPIPLGAATGGQEPPAELRVWSNEPRVPDLHAEQYRMQDVAHLLGMPLDVIRHAIQAGELRAAQAGHDVLSISRTDLLTWLDTRGPGV